MALNSPSNLSLGRLGHIAGGNSGTTNQTSLGATCRGSTGTQTSMWSDFKIGSISFVEDTYFNGGGTADAGYIILSVKPTGDVGTYMGATSGGTDYYVSQYYANFSASDLLVCYIGETGQGGLYQSRIQNRSTNASDYELTTDGITAFSVTGSNATYTEKDKFSTTILE